MHLTLTLTPLLLLTTPLVSAYCYEDGLKFEDLKPGPNNRTVDEAIKAFCHHNVFYEGWGRGVHACFSFPYESIGDRLDIRVWSFMSRVVSWDSCFSELHHEYKGCKRGASRWITNEWKVEIDPNEGPCPKAGRPKEIKDEDFPGGKDGKKKDGRGLAFWA